MATQKNKKTSAIEAHQQVQSSAQVNADKNVRVVTDEQMPVGKSIRQGDIYLTRIDGVPSANTKEEQSGQLAPGSTQGSRHTVQLSKTLQVFSNPSNNSPLRGPVVSSSKDFTLSHPEHADFKLPAGDYQVTYQQDWAEEELRAVRD